MPASSNAFSFIAATAEAFRCATSQPTLAWTPCGRRAACRLRVRRSEVDRFDTLRPQLVIEVGAANATAGERADERAGAVQEQGASTVGRWAPGSTIDLLVEFDDRLPTARAAGKLERYEHFLAGWS